jgi:hypothetical protein
MCKIFAIVEFICACLLYEYIYYKGKGQGRVIPLQVMTNVMGGVTRSTSIHTEPQNYMERAVSFMIRPLYHRRKNPGYTLNTTLGGRQCRARYHGDEINMLLLRKI